MGGVLTVVALLVVCSYKRVVDSRAVGTIEAVLALVECTSMLAVAGLVAYVVLGAHAERLVRAR